MAAFDASPSWSGFNYQGKIALYYAFLVINEKSVDFDFSDYNLVLENTEDFEVVIGEDAASFHQVKAHDSSSFSKYRNALIGISLELYKSEETRGYLHSWKAVNNSDGKTNILDSITAAFAGIVSEYNSCSEKKGKTVIEKAASNNSDIGKPASIIRLALPGRSEQQLVDILQGLAVDNNSVVSRFELYRYPDGKFCCDLGNAEALIKDELRICFSNREMPTSLKQIDNAFHYFLGAIDRHIIERHKNETGAPIPISFLTLIEALHINFEDPSRSYFACEFKNKFMNKFYEFMSDDELYAHPATSHCNLKAIRNVFFDLSPEQLWEHYRHFSPHKYVDPHKILETALDADFEGIFFGLLKIFYAIDSSRKSHNLARNVLLYRKPEARPVYYLPTIISSEYTPKKLAREILKNPHMTESLFEIDKLIYRGECIERLSSHVTEHTDPPMEIGGDARAKRNQIMESISLISIETAKDELNAD